MCIRDSFGREAFELWANTLTEETRFQGKTDEDLSGLCWDLHCSPYCAVCTTDSASYIRRIVETYPDLTMAVKLLPLYEEIWRLKDEIWAVSYTHLIKGGLQKKVPF